MRRDRSDDSDKARSARLFSILVLAGATLAGSLSCTSSAPDPKADGGAGAKDGAGPHFW